MSKRARNVVEPPVFELQRGVLPVIAPVILPDPEAGPSNVKQRSNEVLPCGGSSIRYNRYGKIDVTKLTEAELEELLASESDGGSDCNDDIEDIDWVPNGASSEKELEDVLELHQSDNDDDDENGENVDADMIDQVAEEPDWNATVSLLGPDMTYKNPIPITRTRLHNIIRENGGPTNINMQTRCDTMCKRKSRRWPLIMLLNMVDLSGLAAYVLYSETHGTSNPRRSFLIALANDMATRNITRRAQISHVSRWPHVRNAMLASKESASSAQWRKGNASPESVALFAVRRELYLLNPRYMNKRDLQLYLGYYNKTKKRKHFKQIIIVVLLMCFLSYIFIDFNLNIKLVNLRGRFDFDTRIHAEYNTSQAYFIDLPGCRMPSFPVTDDNVIQFMYKRRNLSCKKGLLRTSENGEYALILNMNAKEIYDSYNIRNLSNLSCNYTEIRRINDQHNQYLKPVSLQLDYNQHFTIKVGIEFLMVECWKKSDEGNIIYKDFHFFVSKNGPPNVATSDIKRDEQMLPEDGFRSLSSSFSNSSRTKTDSLAKNAKDSHLSVMILGMNSVSHLNFLRQMRSSASFIHNNLSHVEFWGYNKVGDNTYPNLMPVLTGLDEDEVGISCLGRPEKPSNVYDNCSLIWKRYKEIGFTTIYAEDVGALNLFNWRHSGFKVSPTDYYLRPILIEMERHVSYEKSLNVGLCMGGRRTADVLLEYIEKLIPVMKRENFFAFFWTVAMTHDLFNMPMLFDKDIRHLLENLNENGVLSRSIIFLMSDHGIRWGSFRKTYQGMMEDRLPLLIALYPQWFKRKYPEAVANLETNAKRLSTPFDLHATLLDLLDLRKLNQKQLTKRISELNDPETVMPRSISLFLPFPKSRNCEGAYISSYWCSCHQQQELPTNDGRVQQAARYVIKIINDRLKNHPQCRALYLNSITYATVAAPHHKIVKELGASDYSIDITLRLQSKPGLGLFESTVRMSSYVTALTGTISRINLYSSQSYCIDDYALKMFCYCHR